MSMRGGRRDLPIFNGRQGDEFTLFAIRLEIALKMKRVWDEVAPIPAGEAAPAAAAAVQAAAADDSNSDEN